MTEANKKQEQNTPFVVFSDDWGVHPSSSQHIFKHIVQQHPVIWINTIGMRRPTFSISDLYKGLRKLAGMLRRAAPSPKNSAEKNLSVYQPPMIPFNDVSLIRKINRALVRRTIKKAVGMLGDQQPVVVSTVPNACDYVDMFRSRKIVYYCVDDFSEWPGLDKQLVLSMELELIEKSDAFLATSPNLFERLSATGKPTSMLSHGVDIELFSADSDAEHAVLDGIPKPRAGYFGLFDERSDQALIAEVAKRMPGVAFVIAGRVETAVTQLADIDNVYFVGVLDYEQLPALVKGLDVLFIPYVVNALSDALSPLKFKEYLATGRSIVCTPIAASEQFENLIHVEANADGWHQAITKSIADTNPNRRRLVDEFLDGESWREKARLMLAKCEA